MIDLKKIKDNKHIILAEKKATLKFADAVVLEATTETIENVNKETGEAKPDPTKLKLKVVINTTNILDSHGDVHIKGLWKKTLKENKNLFLLQEHQMKFDKIISDKINAYTEPYDYNGKELEALIFETEITKERNPFMFEQYQKGFVKNHSVGMRYVKLEMAINSTEQYYKEEKAIWDKYIDQVANKEKAEEQGYFFAVTEAKAIEGSAVVVGSNQVTPTLLVEEKTEPSDDTQKTIEPAQATQKAKRVLIF
jgi:hypothetical protein